MIWKRGIVVTSKDPDSKEPRGLDYTEFLAELGDSVTIVLSNWTAVPDDLTIISQSIVVGNKATQFRMADGTRGQKYVLTDHITCSDGSEFDHSITIPVEDD